MPHFYKRLLAMVIMCTISLGAVRLLPQAFPASTLGDLHYTPVTESNFEPIMTIGDTTITAEEYAYYFVDYASAWNSMLASMGMNWSNVWSEEEFLEQVRGSVDKELTERTATIALVDQYNLHLTREQTAQMLDMKQESIDSLGGYDAFLAQLSNIGLTETMFDNRMYSTAAYERVNDYLFGEGGEYRTPVEDLRAYMDENYLCAKHVLISSETENAETLAAEVAQRAKDGEDFDSLIAEYGEDPGMPENPDGYVFTEGDMVDEFYQGTKALEIGAISDPVESSFGWHIIQRLPIEDDFLELNRSVIEGMMEAYTIDSLLAERAEALSVTRNEELYNAITLSTVQDYLVSANESGAYVPTETDPADAPAEGEPADAPEDAEDAAAS